MEHREGSEPDKTAVWVALWRAMHVQIDPPPHVFEDEHGLKLAAPQEDWRKRPDMDPNSTILVRASIVARARFVEDLVLEQVNKGIGQYVILGAGLDTFAQRKPELASRLTIFEIDRPAPQAWKQQRLVDLGFGIPEWLRFVPVDFESGESWWDQAVSAGFNPHQTAIVTAIGLSMYLTIETIVSLMQQIATLPSGSTFVMSYLLPLDLIDPKELPMREWVHKGARDSGTPLISFFSGSQLMDMARQADFKQVQHISSTRLSQLYFNNRTDGLRPTTSEEILVATT